MSDTTNLISKLLFEKSEPSQVIIKSKFFKTGIGEYAENDIFIGVTVPNIRKIAKQFSTLSSDELQIVLQSKINEERLLALIILVNQYKKANLASRENIHLFYLKNLEHVNHWNLVDTSAYSILGFHLFDKNRDILLDLAKSENLWKRRIAIVSTKYFILQNDLDSTFQLSALLLNDKHDLIHKAVGWMLREAGIKNESRLTTFLNEHAKAMPRTMLRYAIEKFPLEIRKNYLKNHSNLIT